VLFTEMLMMVSSGQKKYIRYNKIKEEKRKENRLAIITMK
jgi:hypothetical protein